MKIKKAATVFHLKVQSGALQLAVIISFIVALICTFFIMYVYLSSSIVDKEQILMRRIHNTNSFINSKLSSLSLQNESGTEFFQEQDTITYSISNWGVYPLIKASIEAPVPIRQSYLLGQQRANGTCLFISNDDQYVAVSGETDIKGIAYVPRLGIRPKMMGNIGYSGKIDSVAISTKDLPATNAIFDEQITEMYSLLEHSQRTGLAYTDSLVNSFFDETKVFYNLDYIPLYTKGNIIIVDEDKIELTEDNECNDIICIAPVIHIRSGFAGNVQLFATDSIIIESNVFLQQPSFVAIYSESTKRSKNTAHITIKQNSKVCGGAYMNVSKFYKQYPRITIEKDAQFIGDLYTENYIENNGEVYGTCYAGATYTHTTRGVYSNVLYNAKFSLIPGQMKYAASLMLEGESIKEIKKLY